MSRWNLFFNSISSHNQNMYLHLTTSRVELERFTRRFTQMKVMVINFKKVSYFENIDAA